MLTAKITNIETVLITYIYYGFKLLSQMSESFFSDVLLVRDCPANVSLLLAVQYLAQLSKNWSKPFAKVEKRVVSGECAVTHCRVPALASLFLF